MLALPAYTVQGLFLRVEGAPRVTHRADRPSTYNRWRKETHRELGPLSLFPTRAFAFNSADRRGEKTRREGTAADKEGRILRIAPWSSPRPSFRNVVPDYRKVLHSRDFRNPFSMGNPIIGRFPYANVADFAARRRSSGESDRDFRSFAARPIETRTVCHCCA